MREKQISIVLFILILFLGFYFRFYGVNWDQGQHLHPDERFLTMVATGISWPKNIFEYLNTSTSPLNPHNRGFGFFVYGTFPVFFTKWVAESLGKGDYGNLTLIGRQLSAFFDLGTVVLVFLIGKQIISNSKFLISNQIPKSKSQLGQLEIRSIRNLPLLTMFLYSIMVLPIQLSHFYAVDTYLTFFITLTFYFLIKIINTNPKKLTTYYLLLTTFLGIAFGLALASKISAVLFFPIIGLGLLFFLIKTRNFRLFFVICGLLSVVCYLTFRLAQPYLFTGSNIFDLTLNPKVLDNWKQLKSFDGPDTGFPPALQWIPTKPYIYPLVHNVIWGLGLPLGIISIVSILYSIVTLLYCYIVKLKKITMKPFGSEAIEKFFNNRQVIILTLIILWIVLLFIYQGSQFAKALRYFYPIYPFLAILSGYFLYQISNIKYQINKLNIKDLRIFNILYVFFIFSILFFILLPTAAFLSIYSRPHSRVEASYWIYQNIPAGKTLGNEYWDDPQPMYIPNGDPSVYKGIMLPLYDPDSTEKWQKLAADLEKIDYIILTSNRLWRSISALPEKYPATSRYYKFLFDGTLGFRQIAVFSSYPCFLPRLSYLSDLSNLKTILHPPPVSSTTTPYCYLALNDDGAEESFTVYDHPKVVIFENTKKLSKEVLFKLIYEQ